VPLIFNFTETLLTSVTEEGAALLGGSVCARVASCGPSVIAALVPAICFKNCRRVAGLMNSRISAHRHGGTSSGQLFGDSSCAFQRSSAIDLS
jgi:hypothetical protein